MNYQAINIETKFDGENVVSEITVGIGVSQDLGLDMFPGMPKGSIEGFSPVGTQIFTFKGVPELHIMAKVFEAYFKALRESSEPKDGKL